MLWICLLSVAPFRSSSLSQQASPISPLSSPSPQQAPPPNNEDDHHYIALYKPALTLCTLRDDQECAQRKHRNVRSTLGSLNLPSEMIQAGLHMCGRLDRDSEGLLLMTTDGKFTSQVCEPALDGVEKTQKRYLARVRNIPNQQALDRMRRGGLVIRGATTRPPVSVELLPDANDNIISGDDDDVDVNASNNNRPLLQMLPKAVPGMEDRKGSYAWLEIVLTEGRNRQIRRITADAGHPTVRLIRVAVGSLSLADLDLFEPGQWCRVGKEDVLSTS